MSTFQKLILWGLWIIIRYNVPRGCTEEVMWHEATNKYIGKDVDTLWKGIDE